MLVMMSVFVMINLVIDR